MAKCNRCGKSGIFLHVVDDVCDDCRRLEDYEKQKRALEGKLKKLNTATEDAEKKHAKAERELAKTSTQLEKNREYLAAIDHACTVFRDSARLKDNSPLLKQIDEHIFPNMDQSLNCMDMPALRKRFKGNEQAIQATYDRYNSSFITTKTNATIYRLMVIALGAELQNILHKLSYGKLEDSLDAVTAIIDKYYAIASDGNKLFAPIIKKFIGEMDYYFKEAVKIEYEYHVQKERAREEQQAIREQMRQEAAERKELERQQKKIEKEESKFIGQIDQLTEQLASADDETAKKLQQRIEELQQQLANVAAQKERIIQLQNGKAGHVYVISNIGSFGDGVFKIGMTRRDEPMTRINELSNASVPFPFDVHSTIFSADAVELETKLHHTLNDRRVNKVNLRKEFFRIDLDELEALVLEVCPTASFKRTILAEQYRQSQSITHVEENPTFSDGIDDDE